MNTATMKHYLDFAADHNLEYLQIDAGWHQGTEEEGDITRSRSRARSPLPDRVRAEAGGRHPAVAALEEGPGADGRGLQAV